jgi:hypothetical protein
MGAITLVPVFPGLINEEQNTFGLHLLMGPDFVDFMEEPVGLIPVEVDYELTMSPKHQWMEFYSEVFGVYNQGKKEWHLIDWEEVTRNDELAGAWMSWVESLYKHPRLPKHGPARDFLVRLTFDSHRLLPVRVQQTACEICAQAGNGWTIIIRDAVMFARDSGVASTAGMKRSWNPLWPNSVEVSLCNESHFFREERANELLSEMWSETWEDWYEPADMPDEMPDWATVMSTGWR